MRKIEFAELLGDPAADTQAVRLTGRCYRGPIRVGDIFTEATFGGNTYEVALRVHSLVFIGKQAIKINKGESGEVILTGQGIQGLGGGVRLRGLMP